MERKYNTQTKLKIRKGDNVKVSIAALAFTD